MKNFAEWILTPCPTTYGGQISTKIDVEDVVASIIGHKVK